MFSIQPYQNLHKAKWNNVINQSQSATFLFYRDFMEYHSDRFHDNSLLIYENERLQAILPANCVENSIHSHQGLTYGGLIVTENFDSSDYTDMLGYLYSYLKQNNITHLYIKALPEFYISSNQKYVDFKQNEENTIVYKSEKVLAIDYSKPLNIHKSKLKNYRKNETKGFVIEEETDFSLFWNKVLCPRLALKHNTKPVHTLKEMMYLKSKFPNNIKQYNIYFNDEVLAGITIFDKGSIVKSQYGATTDLGEKLRAIEYLFLKLIYKYKDEGKSFFSMGTVTENTELGYNPGLLKQKEELGCSTYYQDFYKIML
ncbi:FemAB family protein [Winogradskyella immobilis]|uniref:FemAB family protein n=1 Tax=Winogradskyella immobilis TaxID=2816852 RepID=A0ABS8EP57_9FLAO|nr:FemAB family protein [Winogradskyella immobilis]MCC1484092.1 FemAB family protein [Winogradskyella immobilis]MCG0016184.1 FemAB family protein [Winogradskyella immobilis]